VRRQQRLRHHDAVSGGGDKIAVSLITKDSTNPFFVAMQKGAKSRGIRRGHRHHHRFWQGGRR
jgi:ABC-type sugar transport system substrate-binding protein